MNYQYHRQAERLTRAGFRPEQAVEIVEVQKDVATETPKEQNGSLFTKKHLAGHLAPQNEESGALYQWTLAELDELSVEYPDLVPYVELIREVRSVTRIAIACLVVLILDLTCLLFQWNAPDLVDRARAAVDLTKDAPVVQETQAVQEPPDSS